MVCCTRFHLENRLFFFDFFVRYSTWGSPTLRRSVSNPKTKLRSSEFGPQGSQVGISKGPNFEILRIRGAPFPKQHSKLGPTQINRKLDKLSSIEPYFSYTCSHWQTWSIQFSARIPIAWRWEFPTNHRIINSSSHPSGSTSLVGRGVGILGSALQDR